MTRIAIISLMTILLLIPIMAVNCDSDDDNDFGIYLLTEDIPSNQIASFDFTTVELQDEPLISIDDIVTYSWDIHKITLTYESSSRISSLMPPSTGTPFVVCVGTERIYSGALRPSYSSVLVESVTTIALILAGMMGAIEISVGPRYNGKDPRSDSRIFDSLKHTGKLNKYQ